MGDTKSKITKIVLNNLGAWLEIQMPISVVKMCDRACQDRAKWKDVVLGTMSQTSATGRQLGGLQWSGHVGRSRGLLGRASGFSLLDTVLQVTQ
jgi:hypothetical protein